jgi:hypothetical protein
LEVVGHDYLKVVSWHYLLEELGDATPNFSQDARFEVFTVVKIQIKVFWIVMPCSFVVGYQCFGGPFCLHLHSEVIGDGKNRA